MKKVFNSGLLGLVISGLILGACSQTATYEQADMGLDQAQANREGFILTPLGDVANPNAMLELADCGDGCISERQLLINSITREFMPGEDEGHEEGEEGGHDEGEGHEEGDGPILKTVNFEIWNTPERIIAKLTSNRTMRRFEYFVNGTKYQYDPGDGIHAGQPVYLYFDLPKGYEACEYTLESIKIWGGGPPLTYSGIGYGAYVYCCEEEFTYESNGDGTYTFYYTPYQIMEDAHLTFTFPQAIVGVGLENWTVNGATRQMVMDLTNCETYQWTVELDPACGKGMKNANLWTDFKVKPSWDEGINLDYSVKGSLPNIVVPCKR
ncbi:hypothetical protein [Algoriphagus sp. AK58]|uniref:hypothetical protein n=1 Tax=Algoriphagus sp. AK58 TaxID=1406877 RepID=UPI0016507454|nr:hypothetical protein [Algoriphagus sp. AK58]MBC6365517.1 hypothetical protein [Algoriphagus sp. AK58]